MLASSFPQCFGPNEDQSLDPDASRIAFEELLQTIKTETGSDMTLDEMVRAPHFPRPLASSDVLIASRREQVYGFVTVANEAMARPIRTLTEARGFATSKHILASFGGAGGQHACEIAEVGLGDHMAKLASVRLLISVPLNRTWASHAS
jgi:5-oxoprolinase (ATP-hydrolysing)